MRRAREFVPESEEERVVRRSRLFVPSQEEEETKVPVLERITSIPDVGISLLAPFLGAPSQAALSQVSKMLGSLVGEEAKNCPKITNEGRLCFSKKSSWDQCRPLCLQQLIKLLERNPPQFATGVRFNGQETEFMINIERRAIVSSSSPFLFRGARETFAALGDDSYRIATEISKHLFRENLERALRDTGVTIVLESDGPWTWLEQIRPATLDDIPPTGKAKFFFTTFLESFPPFDYRLNVEDGHITGMDMTLFIKLE